MLCQLSWRFPRKVRITFAFDILFRNACVTFQISPSGGRFETRNLESIRFSFRSAVLEARDSWEQRVSCWFKNIVCSVCHILVVLFDEIFWQAQPANFIEFVRVREQAGEDLMLHKGDWTKDKQTNNCQLCTGILLNACSDRLYQLGWFDLGIHLIFECSAQFGLTSRKHHCRACGALVCDRFDVAVISVVQCQISHLQIDVFMFCSCSSKRLVLTVVGIGEFENVWFLLSKSESQHCYLTWYRGDFSFEGNEQQ